MPRPPKRQHVLRTTLKILGMTQVELADRLGIATVTIEKFLSGDANISEELARRISKETGLDLEQLILNSDPLDPRTAGGTPFAKFRRELRAASEARGRRARMREASRFIKAAVAASLQAMLEADQVEFQMELRRHLDHLIKEFGLRERVIELLELPTTNVPLLWGFTMWKPRDRRSSSTKLRQAEKSAKKPKRPRRGPGSGSA